MIKTLIVVFMFCALVPSQMLRAEQQERHSAVCVNQPPIDNHILHEKLHGAVFKLHTKPRGNVDYCGAIDSNFNNDSFIGAATLFGRNGWVVSARHLIRGDQDDQKKIVAGEKQLYIINNARDICSQVGRQLNPVEFTEYGELLNGRDNRDNLIIKSEGGNLLITNNNIIFPVVGGDNKADIAFLKIDKWGSEEFMGRNFYFPEIGFGFERLGPAEELRGMGYSAIDSELDHDLITYTVVKQPKGDDLYSESSVRTTGRTENSRHSGSMLFDSKGVGYAIYTGTEGDSERTDRSLITYTPFSLFSGEIIRYQNEGLDLLSQSGDSRGTGTYVSYDVYNAKLGYINDLLRNDMSSASFMAESYIKDVNDYVTNRPSGDAGRIRAYRNAFSRTRLNDSSDAASIKNNIRGLINCTHGRLVITGDANNERIDIAILIDVLLDDNVDEDRFSGLIAALADDAASRSLTGNPTADIALAARVIDLNKIGVSHRRQSVGKISKASEARFSKKKVARMNLMSAQLISNKLVFIANHKPNGLQVSDISSGIGKINSVLMGLGDFDAVNMQNSQNISAISANLEKFQSMAKNITKFNSLKLNIENANVMARDIAKRQITSGIISPSEIFHGATTLEGVVVRAIRPSELGIIRPRWEVELGRVDAPIESREIFEHIEEFDAATGGGIIHQH